MITLPTTPKVRDMQVQVIDYSTDLRPPFGGPVQTIHRLGDRYSITFQLPPMLASSPEGRAWMVALTLARRDDAAMTLPLDGLNVGSPGSVIIGSASAANVANVLLKAAAGYTWKAGQWVSLFDADGVQRELHQVAYAVTADSSGNASVGITLPTRRALAVYNVVETVAPTIAGRVTTPATWSTDPAKWMASPSFTVEERR